MNDQPDEVRLARLAAFASVLVGRRKKAVDKRKEQGIDQLWQDDDDYYEGVDEANKGDERVLKGASPGSGFTYSPTDKNEQPKSNAFVNITQPYVDMASARVAEMLLPTDDKPFSIKPTPVPDVDAVRDSTDPMPGAEHMTIGDVSQAFLADVAKKADNAETQIWDWMCESGWHGEMRKVIEQAARIGTGVLKGPLPVKRKMRKALSTGGVMELIIKEEIIPESKWVDVWNIYPDPACGNDIHKGSYLFERDVITAREVMDLRGVPGYMDGELQQILIEGPDKRNTRNEAGEETKEDDQFEIWYYTGQADAEDLRAAGVEVNSLVPLPVSVTIINDRIVKATLSIYDSGEFPYDVMVWSRRSKSWAGRGVARQVRTAQRALNAGWRTMLDNAGVAAGPQIVIRDGILEPADGVWTVTPMKIWRVNEDADVQQAAHAISVALIPMLQAELANIIKMALEIAERATSMPLLLQGEQGSATETVGGMTILDKNASVVLKRIAKISDDNITKPHVTRYYEWLMLYGTDDSCKGDFNIVPLGASAFYQRDAENQFILTLVPASLNPAYNLDPDKVMQETLKINKISPERVRLTDEQIKARAQQPPPVNPAIEVAKARTEGAIQVEQIRTQTDQQEIQAKGQIAQNDMAAKLEMQRADHDHKERMLQMQLNLEMMKLSQAQGISLDKIKADLAQTTMKLTTQKQLSALDVGTEMGKQQAEHRHAANMQALTPPTEPAGRAENGHSFEQ